MGHRAASSLGWMSQACHTSAASRSPLDASFLGRTRRTEGMTVKKGNLSSRLTTMLALLMGVALAASLIPAPEATAQEEGGNRPKKNQPPGPPDDVPGPPENPPGLSRKPVDVPSDAARVPARRLNTGVSGRNRAEVARKLKEVPRLRTQQTRFFKGDDGTIHVAQLFAGAVHYQTEDGSWKPIDNRIVSTETGYRNAANDFGLHLPEVYSATNPITLERAEGSLSFALRGASSSSAIPRAEAVVYRGVFDEVDLKYQMHGSGYKEELILKSAEAPSTFTYEVRTQGVGLTEGDNGTISVVDEDGTVISHLAAPYAEDSDFHPRRGEGARTHDISLALTQIAIDSYLIQLEMPQAWLSDPDREFPVTIDPDEFKNMDSHKDTFVQSNISSSQGGSDTLKVGSYESDGWPRAFSHARFRLSDLWEKGDLVYKAKFGAYNYHSWDGIKRDVKLKRITSGWDETTTWDNKPSVASDVAAISAGCGENKGCEPWQTWDVEDLIQEFSDGTYQNRGFRLHAPSPHPESWKKYYSEEETVSGGDVGPYLTVTMNGVPSAPEIPTYAAGAPISTSEPPVIRTTTPSLQIKNTLTDVNGDDIAVRFQVTENLKADGTPNWYTDQLAYDSDWVDERTAQPVSPGSLLDGKTYYWRVRSSDRYVDDKGEAPPTATSETYKFSVALKKHGRDERWAMWQQQLGNDILVSVNQANGNLVTEYPLDSLKTPAGPLDLHLSYNSQKSADKGISPGWEVTAGPGSARSDLPARFDLLGNADDPWGVLVVYRSGERVTFPKVDKRTYRGGATGGDVIRRSQGPEWSLVTASGSRFTFDDNGALTTARPSTSSVDAPGFNYGFTPGARMDYVEDPAGRRVDFNWDEAVSPARLRSITTWDSRTWTLDYDATTKELIGVTDPELATVDFTYDGKLTGIRDGEANAAGLDQWTRIGYSGGRVSEVKLAGTGSAYDFAYGAMITGNIASNTTVTDPRGAATTDGQDYQTITEFNSQGLPVVVKGPAVEVPGGTEPVWPMTIQLWDEEGKLLCRRDPAANAVSAKYCDEVDNTMFHSDGDGPDLDGDGAVDPEAALQTEYVYEGYRPHRLSKIVNPAPATDRTDERLTERYKYDEGFSGLQAFFYDNERLEGKPRDTSLQPTVDSDWGSGGPKQIGGQSDNFSIRWRGRILADHTGDAKQYEFRIFTEDGARLQVADTQLAFCWGADEPKQANCGNGGKKVWLADRWYPIVLETQHLNGDASVHLQWKKPGESTWSVVPSSNLRPDLGTVTTYKERAESNFTALLERTSSYEANSSEPVKDSDTAKIRGLPVSQTLSGKDTTSQTWKFKYNRQGRTIKETDQAGHSISRTWSRGCEKTTVDRVGLVVARTCNAAGDIEREEAQLDNDDDGTVDQTRVTTYAYDALGRLKTARGAEEGSTPSDDPRVDYAYDKAGHLIQERVYVSATETRDTHFTYTPEGWVDIETLPDPDGDGAETRPTINHDYDPVGNETLTVDEEGNTWNATFDARNLNTSSTDPLENTYSTHYDIAGRAVEEKDPASVTVTRKYDILGRRTTEQLGSLPEQTFDHNIRDLVTKETDADGTTASRTYDAAGNVTTESRPGIDGSGERVRTFAYNGRGYMTKETNELGNERDYTYDEEGRIKTATLFHPAGTTAQSYVYGRNDAGELTSATIARSNDTDISWSASYDQHGRMARERDGVGNETVYHYNRVGEITRIDDPRGLTIDHSYDGRGRLVGSTSSEGSVDDTFAYDRTSQMTLADSNDTGPVEMTYDPAGNLKSVAFGGRTSTLTYDFDRLEARNDMGGNAIDYQYDNGTGRLASLLDPFTGQATELRYTAAGKLKKRTEPSGLTHTIDYEQGLFNSESVVDAAGGEIAYFERTYDATAHVTAETRRVTYSDDNGTWNLDHDAAGRLIGATDPQGVTTTYDYDSAGNRTSVSEGGSTVTYDYDGASRLESSSDGATYTHDPAGNLTAITGGSAGDWTYDYDALDRMTSAVSGTSSIDYLIDGLGRTATRTAGSATTNYYYEELSERPQVVEAGTDDTDIVWLGEEPLVQQQGSATRFYGTTPHGDVTYMVNASGVTASTYTYSPFGEVRIHYGDDSPLGYQSDLTDPDTDLVDMGARQYHPKLGRFTSVDPLRGAPGNPLSMNRYLYAHGSPISMTDPTGLAPMGGTGGSHNVIHVTSKKGAALQNETNSQRLGGGNTIYKNKKYGINTSLAKPPAPRPNLTPPRRATIPGRINQIINPFLIIDRYLEETNHPLATRGIRDDIVVGTQAIATVAGARVAAWAISRAGASLAARLAPPVTAIADKIRSWANSLGASRAGSGTQVKSGASGGPTAGKRFSQAVRSAAKAENPTATCVYCRTPGRATHVDHAIAKVRGGNATLQNAQLTCPWCNLSKGARSFPVNPPPHYTGPWPPPWWRP